MMSDKNCILNGRMIRDVIEWDIFNWSRALTFWKQNTTKDLRSVNALEIGSRGGGLSLWIALQGGKCLCTDLQGVSSAAVELHRKYGVSSHIKYEMLDATTMTHVEKYDVVLFKSVLGGIGYGNDKQKQQAAMDSIYRALKPGGELFFAENLIASPIHQYIRKRCTNWGNQWRYLNLEEIAEFTAQFSVVKFSTAGFCGVFGRTEWQRKLFGWLDRKIFEKILPDNWRYIAFGVAKK
jgi:SAM-dependent methyltransferase